MFDGRGDALACACSPATRRGPCKPLLCQHLLSKPCSPCLSCSKQHSAPFGRYGTISPQATTRRRRPGFLLEPLIPDTDSPRRCVVSTLRCRLRRYRGCHQPQRPTSPPLPFRLPLHRELTTHWPVTAAPAQPPGLGTATPTSAAATLVSTSATINRCHPDCTGCTPARLPAPLPPPLRATPPARAGSPVRPSRWHWQNHRRARRWWRRRRRPRRRRPRLQQRQWQRPRRWW